MPTDDENSGKVLFGHPQQTPGVRATILSNSAVEAVNKVRDWENQKTAAELKAELPSDMHAEFDHLMECMGLPELPTDTQKLTDMAAQGDERAAHALATKLRGKFEAPRKGTVIQTGGGPSGYVAPDPENKKSLEELRANRECTPEVVQGFLDKITDPDFIAPGVALILFISMLTQIQPNFIANILGSVVANKAMSFYYFFREAEEWTKVNILFGMKEWFIRRENVVDGTEAGPFDHYMRPLIVAARFKDQLKAEEANEPKEDHQDD